MGKLGHPNARPEGMSSSRRASCAGLQTIGENDRSPLANTNGRDFGGSPARASKKKNVRFSDVHAMRNALPAFAQAAQKEENAKAKRKARQSMGGIGMGRIQEDDEEDEGQDSKQDEQGKKSDEGCEDHYATLKVERGVSPCPPGRLAACPPPPRPSTCALAHLFDLCAPFPSICVLFVPFRLHYTGSTRCDQESVPQACSGVPP